jgi:phage baseplate assembly protein W
MTNMIQIQSGSKLIVMTVADAVTSARKDAAATAEGKWVHKPAFEATVAALIAAGIDYATYTPTQEDVKSPVVAPARRTIHPARMVAAMDYEASDINHLLRSNGNAAAAE